MNWARPFGFIGTPGTCKWCGLKLRKQRFGDGRGDYGDGHFCGLRCAYKFAIVLADEGRTLKKKAS
jgi:hypothetical protein